MGSLFSFPKRQLLERKRNKPSEACMHECVIDKLAKCKKLNEKIETSLKKEKNENTKLQNETNLVWHTLYQILLSHQLMSKNRELKNSASRETYYELKARKAKSKLQATIDRHAKEIDGMNSEIANLKAKIKKGKETTTELEVSVDYCNELLADKVIQTFEGNAYTTAMKVCTMELLNYNVPAHNVGNVIKSS